jgi:predicted transcriptional regulator of viral defense system
MYGLESIDIRGKAAIVSSRERTLVDLLYYSNPVGGLSAAADILNRFIKAGKCDTKKLIEYAVKFPIIKTRKLIGLTLEKAGVNEKLLAPLEKSVKKTSLISFTDNRKGTINEKWRVIVSAS